MLVICCTYYYYLNKFEAYYYFYKKKYKTVLPVGETLHICFISTVDSGSSFFCSCYKTNSGSTLI